MPSWDFENPFKTNFLEIMVRVKSVIESNGVSNEKNVTRRNYRLQNKPDKVYSY